MLQYLLMQHINFGCGSGFPAANKLHINNADRGWKAAPTSDPTEKQATKSKP
jgi:hypothetical protein